MYASGTRPAINTAKANGRAESSKIVAHDIPPEGGNPACMRFILLEGTSAVIELVGEATWKQLSEGEYVDVTTPTSGSSVIGNPDTFDRDNTPGSEGLMDIIDAVRAERGID
jgi:hypothetical protein